MANRTQPTKIDPLKGLSAPVRRQITAIRKQFAGFAEDFRLVTESRAELAPKFMKAFGAWQTEVGGTFVDFVRVVVPDIGPSRDDYRAHPAAAAANYLRTLAAREARTERSETPVQKAERIASAAVTPTTAVARLVKVLQGLVKPDTANLIWEAMRVQLHWPERTISRIQSETQNVQPLVDVNEPRGLHAIGNLKLAMPQVIPEELQPTGTA